MDPIGGQPFRRCVIATIPGRRPPDPKAADAFRAGWYESSHQRFSLPTTRRASLISTPTGISRAQQLLANDRRSAIIVPAGRPDPGNSGEAHSLTGSSSAANSRVASSILVTSRGSNSEPNQSTSTAAIRNMGGTAHAQPSLAPSRSGNQPVTRSATRMHIASAGSRRTEASAGSTPGAARALELVTRFSWSPWTVQSRNSQWETWVQFCMEEQGLILPVTEGHLIAFIGWLSLARERGSRRVGLSSIPQYLSAFRQMQFAPYRRICAFISVRSACYSGLCSMGRRQFSSI